MKMGLNIFLILVSFVLEMASCGYLLRLKNRCSLEKNEWQRGDQQCKEDGLFYHCILINKTNLAEVCMRKRAISGKHGCPYMNIQGDPQFNGEPFFLPCHAEHNGCPMRSGKNHFYSNELYQYPGCLAVMQDLDRSNKMTCTTQAMTISKHDLTTQAPVTTALPSSRETENQPISSYAQSHISFTSEIVDPSTVRSHADLSPKTNIRDDKMLFFAGGGLLVGALAINSFVWTFVYRLLKKRRKVSSKTDDLSEYGQGRIYDTIDEDRVSLESNSL